MTGAVSVVDPRQCNPLTITNLCHSIREDDDESEIIPASEIKNAEIESQARLAPTALLAIGRGNDHRCVVHFDGVVVDRGCSLSAEVAAPGVEIERADAMLTLCAGEPHAALDTFDTIGFHCLNCSPSASIKIDAMVTQRR